MKELFVLDGTGYIFRSYHAIRGMTNDRGESTNALYGFIRSLLKLMKDFSPEHMVVVFDGPNNTATRKAIYPEYKANRTECPPDIGYQLQWAQDFCKMAGIPMLIVEGVEADDTMGTLAVWGKKEGAKVYLCTSDKDLLQFVNDQVVILQTHKDNLIVDRKGVQEKFGITPEQVVDYLAMVGDSSDNVPGIPGIGPKTASQLLQEHQTLDGVLAATEQMKGKRKENIENNQDLARLSQRLVQIDTEVPLPHQPSEYILREFQTPTVKEFYLDKGFLTLTRELGDVGEPTATAAAAPEMALNYQLCEDPDKLVEKLFFAKEICFDTETTGLDPMQAELVGIGLGVKPGEAWYVPIKGEVPDSLKKLFANPKIAFYAHNAKYDLHILHRHGIKGVTIGFDTMIASYLLNSHSHRHSLDALSLTLFNKVKTPIEELIGKGKKKISMREVAVEKVTEYCCEDVDYTCRLKKRFEKELEERKLGKLFYDLELPLMKVLTRMERKGIYLDSDQLNKIGQWLREQLAELETKIYEEAGEEFNINSPKQLGHILFEKMEIPPPKKTKTGYSTNVEVLETLVDEYPIAQLVMEYRTLEKLRSTYAEALPETVNQQTGRVHCTFNQGVAATGRLSSQNPNLQNIPVRTAEGRRIRGAFRPEKKGWSYLSADYSQIELRLVAHFAEDPELIKAFKAGEDIHAFTASQTFGVPLEEVTKEQRYQAKAINFGILYGQQAFGLARETGLSMGEAKDFIKRYFERYPRIKEYLQKCKEKARKSERAVTISGRERLIPDLSSKNPHIRSAAERLAINTPLQGSAADLIKMAMLDVDKEIEKQQLNGYLVLQIHDELIFEIPDGEIMAFEGLVKKAMEGVQKLKVPLVVDVSIGKNWKEC